MMGRWDNPSMGYLAQILSPKMTVLVIDQAARRLQCLSKFPNHFVIS
jgi:hypothetical protein